MCMCEENLLCLSAQHLLRAICAQSMPTDYVAWEVHLLRQINAYQELRYPDTQPAQPEPPPDCTGTPASLPASLVPSVRGKFDDAAWKDLSSEQKRRERNRVRNRRRRQNSKQKARQGDEQQTGSSRMKKKKEEGRAKRKEKKRKARIAKRSEHNDYKERKPNQPFKLKCNSLAFNLLPTPNSTSCHVPIDTQTLCVSAFQKLTGLSSDWGSSLQRTSRDIAQTVSRLAECANP